LAWTSRSSICPASVTWSTLAAGHSRAAIAAIVQRLIVAGDPVLAGGGQGLGSGKCF
jgi:hypothetical protein